MFRSHHHSFMHSFNVYICSRVSGIRHATCIYQSHCSSKRLTGMQQVFFVFIWYQLSIGKPSSFKTNYGTCSVLTAQLLKFTTIRPIEMHVSTFSFHFLFTRKQKNERENNSARSLGRRGPFEMLITCDMVQRKQQKKKRKNSTWHRLVDHGDIIHV